MEASQPNDGVEGAAGQIFAGALGPEVLDAVDEVAAVSGHGAMERCGFGLR